MQLWVLQICIVFSYNLLAIAFVAALSKSCQCYDSCGFSKLVRILSSGRRVFVPRNMEFVEAAVVLGMDDKRIIFNHILPNSAAQ